MCTQRGSVILRVRWNGFQVVCDRFVLPFPLSLFFSLPLERCTSLHRFLYLRQHTYQTHKLKNTHRERADTQRHSHHHHRRPHTHAHTHTHTYTHTHGHTTVAHTTTLTHRLSRRYTEDSPLYTHTNTHTHTCIQTFGREEHALTFWRENVAAMVSHSRLLLLTAALCLSLVCCANVSATNRTAAEEEREGEREGQQNWKGKDVPAF